MSHCILPNLPFVILELLSSSYIPVGLATQLLYVGLVNHPSYLDGCVLSLIKVSFNF